MSWSAGHSGARVARGDRLTPESVVLRRFDPADPTRCTFDEAGRPARLRSSAFKFDAVPEESPTRKECSVYHRDALHALGLRSSDCIEAERPGWRVALASVAAIKAFARSNVPDPNPFEVVEDPFPNGTDKVHPRDAAHANIVHELPLRGADKWYRDLAMTFHVEVAQS